MAIEFVCPACAGTLRVGDESAGRVIRCGACMTALRVPAADPVADPDPPAAPDPYHNSRAYPPPPPPPPPRHPPAPTNAEPPDEVPPAARPVAPPRRDRDDPRERRPRRAAPPPSGYGVFFWLVVVGAVLLVGVVGCCGGFFLLLPDTKWQKHASKDGGFKVDLPAKPQPNIANVTGLKLEKDTRAEGAVLLKRAEKFVVIYRDIKSTKVRAKTDEQELAESVEKLQTVMKAEQGGKNEPIAVGGFPGREIEFQAETGWHAARVIVADTRLYIVLVGGGMAQKDDPRVRQFFDSFEITDATLVAEGKRRAEQAKLAAEAAKEARDRGAKGKAGAPPPRPDDD